MAHAHAPSVVARYGFYPVVCPASAPDRAGWIQTRRIAEAPPSRWPEPRDKGPSERRGRPRAGWTAETLCIPRPGPAGTRTRGSPLPPSTAQKTAVLGDSRIPGFARLREHYAALMLHG